MTSQFELKLMSIEEDCLEIPEVAPDAIIVVEAAALKDTCQHLGMLSDVSMLHLYAAFFPSCSSLFFSIDDFFSRSFLVY